MKNIDDLISHLKTIPGDIQPDINKESFKWADYSVKIDGGGRSLEELFSNADIDTLISSIRTAPSRKDADAYAIYWFKQQLLNKIQ